MLPEHPAFELLETRELPEIQATAGRYRHRKTGADVISVICEDDNKSFSINFRTPPEDSTGVAHILEHSVLCGSAKYPSKEPFKELMKGSLNTFLNAFTYPDKTCYPVASRNETDFNNLVDVYLDAVLHPNITEQAFMQEGWHIEWPDADTEPQYKGVVFNEMKGAYSSPDGMVYEVAQQSLFPDITYGQDSGGRPSAILDLTYDQFVAFHKQYYHPCNAMVFFYGDDDPAARLDQLESYFKDFEAQTPPPVVPRQPRFTAPISASHTYAAGEEDEGTFVTVNWLLGDTDDLDHHMALGVLSYLLIGSPASPLRRALIESGLGEDICGGGLEGHVREMYFSTGLKGVKAGEASAVEKLIGETIERLSIEGFDPDLQEAALNAIEFSLRENNTGSFPRGLALMLRSLTCWTYFSDPFGSMSYEPVLDRLKASLAEDPHFFRNLVTTWFRNNVHRSTVDLAPDATHGEREQAEETARLAAEIAALDDAAQAQVHADTHSLLAEQERPDRPEDLAAIPSVTLADVPKEIPVIDSETIRLAAAPVNVNPQPTQGVVYLDLAFDLRPVDAQRLPAVSLWARHLLEGGTKHMDYIRLAQRIARDTGGIDFQISTFTHHKEGTPRARLIFRAKALASRFDALCDLLTEILTEPGFHHVDRLQQILLEDKAAEESGIIPAGHSVVKSRLSAQFSAADAASEAMGGIEYLQRVRNWVEADAHADDLPVLFAALHDQVIHRSGLQVNLTLEAAQRDPIERRLADLLACLPDAGPTVTQPAWKTALPTSCELLTLPSQVHYVGSAWPLFDADFPFHGSALVATRLIRNNWLWEKVRVQGGAYGAFCSADRITGHVGFFSYRDPNVAETLATYNGAAAFLRSHAPDASELERNIIGTLGDLDPCQLPDAKGYSHFMRQLMGYEYATRQQIREEVFATTPAHIAAFSDALLRHQSQQQVCVLGPESAQSTLHEYTESPPRITHVL